MENKKISHFNLRKIIVALVAVLAILVAVIGIIEIPKATSNEDVAAAATNRFEEVDAFTITKMEITTYVNNENAEVHNCYVSLRNDHVAFMAKVDFEQYLYYNVGDTVAGTLIAEDNNASFELDEFGKSFVVLGYIGLAD